MAADEIPLAGNVTSGVVRIGDTVRRPVGLWTEGVDALLRHLEDVGFNGAPRSFGRDEEDRQVLEFIRGEVGCPDMVYTDTDLEGIARLLRDFHEASSSFPGAANYAWHPLLSCPSSQEPLLVCHNDAAPWNLVRRDDGSWALIDWDGAAPGTRGWELAYTAQTALSLASGGARNTGLRRLGLFLRAYGSGRYLDDLPRLMAARPRAMAEMLRAAYEAGLEPWARIYREDGLYWSTVADFIGNIEASLNEVMKTVGSDP